ncbi:NUDIX domain-containing protein [Winogradskyella echinorum]|uniref:GDP-mannose pyrophosphatase n=2 Tax=Winogradskyella echinorum TaxID=538189 RepID=A0ABR6Y177_9FLAO|nr:NUDIX domain-containing protein [Winogradskyella echinorum]MBC5750856.1 NUDIX domain-containing protein [Winogradskyella echinorum]
MSKKRIKNMNRKILSDKFFTLSEVQFDYQLKNGNWVENTWEVLERGNAVAALLYNTKKQTVIFVKQFRLPAYMNGIETGFLLEVPAGMLDDKDDSAEEAMKREILEETGYNIPKLTKIYNAFATPGGSTERFSCFVGEYDDSMKVAKGGGLDAENEDIIIIEMPFKEAIELISSGEIVDAKTIMLLQYAQIKKLLG